MSTKLSVPASKRVSPLDTTAKTGEVPVKGGKSRTAWMGGLTKEELVKPGGILLAMLTARANELGQQLSEMSEELNVTYGYIAQLRTGVRKVENISDEFATACALYLGVPRMTVLLAAGRVRPEDVYADTEKAIASISPALRFMQADEKFGAIMPPAVLDLPLDVQFFIVQLYEAATERKLLPGNQDPKSAALQIEQFQKKRAELIAELDRARLTKVETASERKASKVAELS